MAKSSKQAAPRSKSAAVAPGEAEGWLTAAERKLLDGTLGRTLARASQKQLQKTLARARTLRDKWRDLFTRQMQSAKRSRQRGASVNSRSLDKAELFAAAVRRVEARLGELLEGTAPATGRKASGRSSPAKPSTKTSKPQRAAGHRGTRAAVRKSLAELTEAGLKPSRPRTTAKKRTAKRTAKKPAEAAAKPAAKKKAAQAGRRGSEDQTATASRSAGATAKATSKKARQAGARKTAAAAPGAVGYDRKKQRSAKASATATRIKFDGLTTRRRGHTLAAGKRRQARRDGR